MQFARLNPDMVVVKPRGRKSKPLDPLLGMAVAQLIDDGDNLRQVNESSIAIGIGPPNIVQKNGETFPNFAKRLSSNHGVRVAKIRELVAAKRDNLFVSGTVATYQNGEKFYGVYVTRVQPNTNSQKRAAEISAMVPDTDGILEVDTDSDIPEDSETEETPRT